MRVQPVRVLFARCPQLLDRQQCFATGWPPADSLLSLFLSEIDEFVRELRETVTYDFVESIHSLIVMSFCSWGEKYKDHFAPGVYVCAQCDNPLFKSTHKYKHCNLQ